jgi:hypothetical protein
MAFVQLFGCLARDAVHHAPALHRVACPIIGCYAS